MRSAAMIDNIRLRISADEKQLLTRAASSRGVTLSEFIRDIAMRGAGKIAA
ncbi:MAG: DUF1778 domain-containing protein [Rhizobiaceae bacterium]